MAIKEIPTKLSEYKTSCMRAYTIKKEKANLELEEKKIEANKKHKKCLEIVDSIKDKYAIDFKSYSEFNEEKYIDGSFVKTAKGLYLKSNNHYEVVADLYHLYTYALLLETIKEIQNEIVFCDKILALDKDQYRRYLEVFFLKVHEKLVLDGYGYVFGHKIGWLCVNRVKQLSGRKLIDYKKTRERKAELLAQGKRLYNKEDEQACKALGLDYDGVDYRVWKDNEYNYEVCLLESRFTNATDFNFIASDWRHTSIRGKSNEELEKECHNDPKEIVKLKVDIKTKVTMCTKVDDLFYTKFIRNENQESYKVRTARRKN